MIVVEGEDDGLVQVCICPSPSPSGSDHARACCHHCILMKLFAGVPHCLLSLAELRLPPLSSCLTCQALSVLRCANRCWKRCWIRCCPIAALSRSRLCSLGCGSWHLPTSRVHREVRELAPPQFQRSKRCGSLHLPTSCHLATQKVWSLLHQACSR